MTTSSTRSLDAGSMSSPKNARPASRLCVSRRSGCAMLRDSGPDSRTTPMPPRPGGVAMATMVSSRCTIRIIHHGQNTEKKNLRDGGAKSVNSTGQIASNHSPGQKPGPRMAGFFSVLPGAILAQASLPLSSKRQDQLSQSTLRSLPDLRCLRTKAGNSSPRFADLSILRRHIGQHEHRSAVRVLPVRG